MDVVTAVAATARLRRLGWEIEFKNDGVYARTGRTLRHLPYTDNLGVYVSHSRMRELEREIRARNGR